MLNFELPNFKGKKAGTQILQNAIAVDGTPDQRAELDRHISAGLPSERAGHLGGPPAIQRRIARLQKGVPAEQRCRLALDGIVPCRSADNNECIFGAD